MFHPGSGFPCWCRSRSGSGLALQRCQSSEYFFIFSHSIASLQFFIFIFSVKCTLIFSVFFTHYWNFLEKSQVYQLLNLLGLDTNPDRHSLDADPDPAKWCGSNPIRIRIHNTTWQWLTCERVSTLFSTFFFTRTLSFFKNCIHIEGGMGEGVGNLGQSSNDFIT